MKPTYGRVSRYGLVAYASSLDQIGPFANDVAGAALLLEAIAGHDRRDSTSVDSAVPEYSLTVEEPLAGLKIGIAKEHFVSGLDHEVEQALFVGRAHAVDVPGNEFHARPFNAGASPGANRFVGRGKLNCEGTRI